MEDKHIDINEEFGVEDGVAFDASPECASTPAVLVPQFSGNLLSDRPRVTPWPPKLVFDLALALDDLETILLTHNLTDRDYEQFMAAPSFRRELAVMTRELAENGVSFQQKARMQAESYLLDVDDIVKDREVAAATRLDAIKSTVKWADLEPKQQKQDNTNANQVNIQINF